MVAFEPYPATDRAAVRDVLPSTLPDPCILAEADDLAGRLTSPRDRSGWSSVRTGGLNPDDSAYRPLRPGYSAAISVRNLRRMAWPKP